MNNISTCPGGPCNFMGATTVISNLIDTSGNVMVWTTRDTYLKLYERFKTLPPDPEALMISAVILEDNTVEAEPWYTFFTDDISTPDPEGSHSIVFLDDNDDALSEFPFSPEGSQLEEYGTGELLPEEMFVLSIPTVAGTAKVEIWKDDTVLYRRTVSDASPVITSLFPAGGEVFNHGQSLTVTWVASDTDSSELWYAVFFSDDNGTNWYPIAFDTNENDLDWVVPDTATVNGRVKVLATDGVNSSELISGVFTINGSGAGPIVACAGLDQTIELDGTSAATILDGSASRDPGGGLLEYWWELVASPAGSTAIFSDNEVSMPHVSMDKEGSYLFTLTVNNSTEVSIPDYVLITANLPPDRDGDGVPDHTDLCPDDPEDEDYFQEEDGCPEPGDEEDWDGDGFFNEEDPCPDDPEDWDFYEDEDGCPEPGDENDYDGDGLTNAIDVCPYDPEDFDGVMDHDGCPEGNENDVDGDGISDMDDQCPTLPEDINSIEDGDGCPEGDAVRPSTSFSFLIQPNVNGWNNTQVDFSIWATDNPDGSGVEKIYYGIDNPVCEETLTGCVENSNPFTEPDFGLSTGWPYEGRHTLIHFARDRAGNFEPPHTVFFNTDLTPPVSTAELSDATKVVLEASDELSGVAKIEYNLNEAGWIIYTAPVQITTFGQHILQYRAVDIADNIEAANDITVINPAPEDLDQDGDCDGEDLALFAWQFENNSNTLSLEDFTASFGK